MQGARVVDSAILDSDDDDSYGCTRLAPLQGHSSSSASQRESSAESAQHRWKCCCMASSRCLFFSFILLCEASHCVHIGENRNGTKIKRQKKNNRTGSLLQWKSSLFYLSQCFAASVARGSLTLDCISNFLPTNIFKKRWSQHEAVMEFKWQWTTQSISVVALMNSRLNLCSQSHLLHKSSFLRALQSACLIKESF